jgi:peptidoglycan hydrolase CwlO-like protein
MHLGRLAAAMALCLAVAGRAAAAPPKSDATAVNQSWLNQMAESEKWQGEQIWHIRNGLEALPGLIAEAKDENVHTQEDVDKLRDEVKGLYVEITAVKQQIDSLKENIDAVNTNVTRARSLSAFFLGLMALMVVAILAMTIRR